MSGAGAVFENGRYIHDRVNYAVTEARREIDKEKKVMTVGFTMLIKGRPVAAWIFGIFHLFTVNHNLWGVCETCQVMAGNDA